MTRLLKTLLLFFMLLVCAVAPLKSVKAASAYPANVKKLSAKAQSDTSVKLTWSAASRATGYRIYVVDPDTNTKKRAAATKNTSCIIKGIEVDKTYVFQVYAYRKSGRKIYWSKKGSPLASVKTRLSTPGAIKNFRYVCAGNESVFLAWDKAKNADSYIVYRYDKTSGKYKKIGSTKNNTYQAKKLKAGSTYRFKVQAYHAVRGQEAYGSLSKAVSAKAKKVNVADVHGRYWNATVKKTVTARYESTGKKLTLKAGTKIAVPKRVTSTATAVLTNGKKIKVNGSALRYGGLLYTVTRNYSTEQKEAFVNGRGYSSDTPYLIWISQYTCNTTIFKGSKGAWKVVRSMPCVIGRGGHTPVGVFKLCRRGSYRGKPMIYFTWNQRMYRGNAFHCRIDGNVKTAASLGCVRLGDSDLYYVANNCALGTTVVSY